MDNHERSTAALIKLDEIEAEMKRIGYWSATPPPGESIQTFEQWLQRVFIPDMRAAAKAGALPGASHVGHAAMLRYDYHSFVQEAQTLFGLLSEFNAIIEGRGPQR